MMLDLQMDKLQFIFKKKKKDKKLEQNYKKNQNVQNVIQIVLVNVEFAVEIAFKCAILQNDKIIKKYVNVFAAYVLEILYALGLVEILA